MFDVGGIIGAIAAGVLSDYTGMSACTCAGMLIFAIPLVNTFLILIMWILNIDSFETFTATCVPNIWHSFFSDKYIFTVYCWNCSQWTLCSYYNIRKH